ncbi:MAG: NAD(P)/FAD-dependent oxidoreductase [Rhizobiaceae bacterium]|nr:NAD(P)/FAD-dependent oxidoreductase [Rhizobiaceae bacterium]
MQDDARKPDAEADVLVIGTGPAGLAAATELKKSGVSSVIAIERSDQPGGIPRFCGHSPFGMREFHRVLSGPAYADRLAETARRAGVDLRLRHSAVGSSAPGEISVAAPDGLLSIRAKRIVLATGARETSRAAALISGDRPVGVMNTNALQLFAYREKLKPFRRPLVVGSELVSMSAILTCVSIGAKPVALVEPRPSPILRRPFSLLPNLLGIKVHYGTRISEIVGSRRVESVRLLGPDGAASEVECDGVVLTGRFTSEAALARRLGLEIDEGTAGPMIDDRGRTSAPWIYAVGNMLHPVETAGWSWAEGRRIARMVARDLADAPDEPARATRVTTGHGIRYAVPQWLGPEGVRGMGELQVRIGEPVSGRLVVESDGRQIWSKPMTGRPEQRVLIPIGALLSGEAPRTINVRLENA